MYKKNYLTMEEQKIWDYISDKEIVDNELVKFIFPDVSENKRNKLLHNLFRKGYLLRARKDIYYNPKRLDSYYKLALRIKEGYIGLSSALRYYNLLDYEDFTVFIITRQYRKTMVLKGTQYELKFIPFDKLFIGFEKKDNIYISSVEKTIFDCLIKHRFVGLTNIAKAIYDAKLNWSEFIRFFKLTKNHALHQRAGYLLEMLKRETKKDIPDFVFDELAKKIKNPVKLISGNAKSSFDKKWNVQDNFGKDNILSW